MSAAKLAPNDALPIANLSVVNYEMGNYTGAVLFAQRALKLLSESPQQSESASSTSALKRRLEERVEKCKQLNNPTLTDAAKRQRTRIIDCLPRYKPCVQPEPQYYSQGHDHAEALVDKPLLQKFERSLSFFYGGVGDARNVLATIYALSLASPTQQYHITMCDHKPAIFARDLIVFELLSQIGHTSNDLPPYDNLDALCYIYAAEVMPKVSFQILQNTISQVISQLEGAENSTSARVGSNDIVYIPENAKAPILRHLRAWQLPPERWYSAPRMALKARAGWERDGEHIDRDMYQDCDHTWEPNVTLIDMDWETKREMSKTLHLSVEGNPKTIATQLARAIFGRLFLVVSEKSTAKALLRLFFQAVAQAMHLLSPRLVLEVALGDMSQTFERLEHGTLRTDYAAVGALNPATFPSRYDRAYLSNVPDYVGGPLTTFLYGLPILKEAPTSEISSYVMRNPMIWPDHNNFLSEHLLLPDHTMIQTHFHTHVSTATTDVAINKKNIVGFLVEPVAWVKLPSKQLTFEQLLSRQELNRWLYAHFLKICIPFPRPRYDHNHIITPLNLTIFFRIVERLHAVGYPSHWLTSVLAVLSSGNITTTARAPRAMIVSPEQAKERYPSRDMTIAPFASEFRTLLAIWKPALLFGAALEPAAATTVPLSRIRSYTLRFPPLAPSKPGGLSIELLEVPHFVLLFWRVRYNNGRKRVIPKDMRAWLLDDEEADASADALDTRKHGVHVVSSFTWHDGDATFWFDEAVMESMWKTKEPEWTVYVWRTDVWLASPFEPVVIWHGTEDEVLARGDYWPEAI